MKKLLIFITIIFCSISIKAQNHNSTVVSNIGNRVGLIGSTGSTGTGFTSSGSAKLTAGFDTVKTGAISSSSKVQITGTGGNTGTMGVLFESKSQRSNGVYFIVKSSIAIDTTGFTWIITP